MQVSAASVSELSETKFEGKVQGEAPAKVSDRGFPTKGVIAGNDHRN